MKREFPIYRRALFMAWKKQLPELWKVSRFIPYFIFLGALSLTVWAWYLAEQSVEKKTEERFSLLSAQVRSSLQTRLADFADLLYGTAGLFAGSIAVYPEEWTAFIQSQKIPERFQGMHSIFFLSHLSESQYIVQYIEPAQSNKALIGFDLSRQAGSQSVLKRAQDTGKPSATQKIFLLLDPAKRPAFDVYMPLFRSRRASTSGSGLIGFIGASFIVSEFASTTLNSDLLRKLNVTLYDGAQESPENLLYTSDNSGLIKNDIPDFQPLEHLEVMQFGGRTWSLRTRSLPAFMQAEWSPIPMLILFAGVVTTISMTLFGTFLLKMGQNARIIAEKMTRELQESESAVRELYELTSSRVKLEDKFQYVFALGIARLGMHEGVLCLVKGDQG
jgi:CHASE1-domain containing sensor protein